ATRGLPELPFRLAGAGPGPSGRGCAAGSTAARRRGGGRWAGGGADPHRHLGHAGRQDGGPAGARRESATGPDPHRPPLPLRADDAALLMRRAAIIVLDGLGIGPAPDTHLYGDAGSDTLGNVARTVGGLPLPQLATLGLGHCAALTGMPAVPEPRAAHGICEPRSAGKDSTTGH